MKRILSVIAFVFLLAGTLHAGTIPVSGTITLPNGTKLNGKVRFTLSYSAARDSCSSYIIVAQTVEFTVNNGIPQTTARITGNDCLQPSNTWYTAEYVNSFGTRVGQQVFYITGSSFVMGQAQPTPVTTSNISFNNFTGLTQVTSSHFNNLRLCDQFTGATASIKITACVADLPSTGGTADATSIEGTQTWTTNAFSGVTKPVDFVCGAATYTVSITSTLPANVHLVARQGCVFSVNAGITFTISGSIDGSSVSQHFSGSGTVAFNTARASAVYPQWWGALGDGSNDDTSAIQSAINAAYSAHVGTATVQLPCGAYKTTSAISLYSGITVNGCGSGEYVRPYSGTHIVGSHTGNVFSFDTTKDTAFYHFGGVRNLSIIKGTSTPNSGIYIYQAGENFVIDNVSIYQLTNGIILGDGTVAASQVSATLRSISLHQNTSAGIWIRRCASGLINLHSISADDNGYALRIDNTADGESCSINVNGIKTEVNSAMTSLPIQLSASYVSLNLIGGWVGDCTNSPTAAISIGTSGTPRIFSSGIKYLCYTNAVEDHVSGKTIPSTSGGNAITEINYNNQAVTYHGPISYSAERLVVGDLTNAASGLLAGSIYIGTSGVSEIYLDSISAASDFYGRRAGGTQAARTNVSNGQGLMDIRSAGYSGATGYWDTAKIQFVVDAAVTNNQRPASRIGFSTNTDGGAVTEQLRINKSGYVRLQPGGVAAASAVPLSIIGADTLDGYNQTLNIQSGASGTATRIGIGKTATEFLIENSTTGILSVLVAGASTPVTITSAGITTVAGAFLLTGISSSGAQDYLCFNTSTSNVVQGTAPCTASSERYKHDFKPLTGGLETVLRLPTYSYVRNDHPEIGRQVGLKAEDADLVDPRIVGYDEQGRPDRIRYDTYTAILTRAIQELEVRLRAVEAR